MHNLQPETILIRSTNWIGDAMMSTPAVRAIRKNFPGADIRILAKPWVAPVFENNPYLNGVLLYDGAGRHKGMFGKVRLAAELRRHHFDAAILLQNAFEAALIAFLAGIPCRIGFNTDGRSMLLTHPVPCTSKIRSIHQTRYYPAILEGAGLKTDGYSLDLAISAAGRRRAEQILLEHGCFLTNRIIGINPGATYGTAKRWFPERYAELCRRLRHIDDFHFIVFGSMGDERLGEQIRCQIGNECMNLCGKTSLEEAMALIELCRLFITNDSGLMHIAAALDVPLIAIFGSTDPLTTSPVGHRSHIVSVPTPCSPCLKTDCPTDHRCMKAVTVDRVFDIANRLLL